MNKKWIKGAGLLAAGFFLLPVPVLAASEKSVSLEAEGEGVQVKLELPEPSQEEILSLQLSLQIETVAGQAGEASFVFDSEISSSVKESRYHEDTGILNLYISGKENLFADQEILLGEVQITAADEKGVKAEVSVVEDSLIYVNAAFSKSQEHVNAPARVELIVGNGGVEAEPTVTPEPSGEPSPTVTPEPTGNPTPTGTPGDTETSEPSEEQPDQGSSGETDVPESVSPQNPDQENTGSDTNGAQTGDNSGWELYIVLSAVAASCLICLLIGVGRKRVRK